MVRSKLAAAILSASLALPGMASALGIGEYTLKSYLNQPLELEIDLVQTKDLSTEEVIAALGSQDDFSRAGVERLFFLTDIRFEVRQRTDGSLAVVARTSKPVTEPFLNFLMEVQWPQGRMLREYTILLDPPVYRAAGASATATAAPVAQAPAAEQAAAPQPAPAAVQAPVAAPAPAQVYVPPAADSSLPPPPTAARQGGGSRPLPTPAPQPAPVSSGGAGAGEYQVQASDTMWEIAARNRAGSASVQQTMMAIQRANPDAFIRGNVNLVKRGYVLRIPGEAEAQEVSTATASSQFAEQTRAWRELLDQRQASLPTDSAQLQAGGSSRPAAPAAKGTGAGEVTLVAPSASGGSKASGGKQAAALQNQLAIAEEGLDKAARENKELASRLADLDKQVKGSDKLLAMKNDEIAGLQSELNRLRKEKGAAPAEAVKPAEAEPATAESMVEEPAVEPAPAVAEKPAKPKSDTQKEKPAKSAKKQEEGGSILVPVVGVLALLGIGGAGFWFWRRKQAAVPKAQAEYSEDAGEGHDAQIADDLAQLQDLNLGGTDDEPVSPAAADSETADPMGEADMYMAYGRFQQAADILYAALQREPDRGDLRVKLAEVYAEMGDNNAAREQASLAAQGGASDVRSQANALLARLGVAAAPVAASAAGEESLPSLDDLAMEFSGTQEHDLGGTLDFAPAETMRTPAVSTQEAEAEESLDFSLDDISLPSDEPEAAPASVSQTAVRPRQDLEELSLDDAGLGEFTLDDDEKPADATAGDELSLDEFSLDDEPVPAAPVADELSLESDLDFAGDADADLVADLPSLDDEVLHAEPEAVTAVQPAVNVDLESELADLQSDLSGEGMGLAEESKGGDDFDFLADSDENATKLDLAKAYIDMGDAEGARDILNEVVADGSDAQKSEARKLLDQVG